MDGIKLIMPNKTQQNGSNSPKFETSNADRVNVNLALKREFQAVCKVKVYEDSYGKESLLYNVPKEIKELVFNKKWSNQ